MASRARTASSRPRRRERGTGSIRQLSDGRWRASLELDPDPATGDRRRVSAIGRTKTEAMSKAREKQRQVDRTGIYQARRSPTLAEWLDTWMRDDVRPFCKPKTTETYACMIEHHIKPAIGGVRLSKLKPHHFQLMENQIIRGDADKGIRPCSPTTANLCHRIVKTALRNAVANGLIERNPAELAKTPRCARPDIAILTTEQAARMINMEPDPMWHLMWRIAFATGMRQGERLGITVSEIIVKDGMVCINVAWQLKLWTSIKSENDLPNNIRARHLDGDLWLTQPKTAAGRRIIPLPDDLARELRDYMRANNRTQPDQLVFVKADGRPISPHTEQYAWQKALDRAGLPRVRIHSARHTAATAMMRMGISDAIREAIIGHSSIRVTNEVYTHVDMGMALKAVQGIETQVTDITQNDKTKDSEGITGTGMTEDDADMSVVA